MGDVFTILALIQFGPGPALVTYWVQMLSGVLTVGFRHYGISVLRQTDVRKLSFNLSQCAISTWAMYLAYLVPGLDAALKRAGALVEGREFIRLLTEMASEIRELRSQDKLPLDFSTRSLIKMVRHIEMFPEDYFYFLDVFIKSYNVGYLSHTAIASVRTLIQAKFPMRSIWDEDDATVKDWAWKSGPVDGDDTKEYFEIGNIRIVHPRRKPGAKTVKVLLE